MKKLLKKVLLVAMTVVIGSSTVSFASAAETASGTNLFTEVDVDKPSEALIQPLIESDGTMTFTVSAGSQLWSTEFKVSDTSTRFTHTTKLLFPNQTSETTFQVTLQKKGLFGWSDVGSAVTMTANGTSRQYDWTDLSTSTTYRLYFYSPNYAITGSGSLSNYVHP